MKIISWNINGLRARRPELELLISKHNPDIILLQETMLMKTTVIDNFDHYNITRRERDTGYRGGVAILSRKEIDFHAIENSPSTAETTTIIASIGRRKIQITSAYLPPGRTRKRDLLATPLARKNIILGGDLNAKNTNWGHQTTNNHGKWIEEWTDSNNLSLIIPDMHTRISNRTNDIDDVLDYYVTSQNMRTTLDVLTEDFCSSDHIPIKLTIHDFQQQADNKYFKTNWAGLIKKLDRPYQITGDVQYDVRHFTATVQCELINNTRVITKRTKEDIHLNPRIKNLIILKREADRLHARQKTKDTKKALNKLKTQLHQGMQNLKEERKIERMKEIEDPNKRWKILKNDKPKPPPIPTLHNNNKTAKTNQEKAEMLAEALEEKFQPIPSNQNQQIKEEVQRTFTNITNMKPENPPEITIEELEEAIAETKTNNKGEELLNEQLQKLYNWCQDWKTKINPTKSEAMYLFDSPFCKRSKKIVYNNTPIPATKNLKYLGIILDPNLNFKKHVDYLEEKLHVKANSLSSYFRQKNIINTKTRLQLYDTLVKPTITYALPAWDIVSPFQWSRLEVSERRWMRMIHMLPPDYKNLDIYKLMDTTTLKEERNTAILRLQDFCNIFGDATSTRPSTSSKNTQTT
ncbi:RNA-directed DNA polymerase from mobile element jockey [Frankliniella fusca]|uniref:RNA-directed DNA polymerase from mobile element jockey n=1 Tax=Frankliniella fusca TaxID=407009 RepID=A0AAE1LUK5_9NEOP|nr:RNA-directed DNA polymerase from mobile element jockey [Frankliniella fusca]